jgi:hypothetical protein
VKICEHYICRCARAAELAEISERTGEARYVLEAIAVHHEAVACRLAPIVRERGAGDGSRRARLRALLELADRGRPA